MNNSGTGNEIFRHRDLKSQGDEIMRLQSIILDSTDINRLSQFYCSLLGWKPGFREGDQWMAIQNPEGGADLAFQRNEDYVPPVWPEQPGCQQMMAHVDFGVKDSTELKKTVEKAIALGAKQAETQYGGSSWVTMLDPDGHPFCFVVCG